MSKLMYVLGIVLLAVGAALALVGFVNAAQMQIHGLTMDTAATLLTGGVLSVGLGGVIAALLGRTPATVEETVVPTIEAAPVVETIKAAVPAVEAAVESVEEPPARVRFPGFGRKTAAVVTGVTATTVAVTEAAAEPAKSAVDDTIAALEQAKADIANAIGGVATVTEDKVDDVVEVEEDVVEDVEETGEGELYVLEERDIRGRPARILSDNTVEAETDEGWMRFENLEHLNEYLDAAGEPA